RDALPGEVDAFVRPARRVVRLAAEAVDALDVDRLRQGKAAARHDVEAAPDGVAAVGADAPPARVGGPGRRLRPRREADVASEVVPVGDVSQVAQDLRLRRVALRPVPRPLELRVEAVRVVDALDVAARAGVAVPVPGPADVRPALDPDRAEAEGSQ